MVNKANQSSDKSMRSKMEENREMTSQLYNSIQSRAVSRQGVEPGDLKALNKSLHEVYSDKQDSSPLLNLSYILA